jgi:hypothetical protein
MATELSPRTATTMWPDAGRVVQVVDQSTTRPAIQKPRAAEQDSRSRANYFLLCGTAGVAGP